MNKQLAWLPAFIILATVIYKPVKEGIETKPVTKNISLSVYKSSSYTSVIYSKTSAQVNITVEKVNTWGQHTIVWDKKLEQKYLSQYPSVENALIQNITINNLDRKREHLVVHYIVTYNSKGSTLQMHSSAVLTDNAWGKVDISI
jgi:hypothetical protein